MKKHWREILFGVAVILILANWLEGGTMFTGPKELLEFAVTGLFIGVLFKAYGEDFKVWWRSRRKDEED